MTQDVLIAGVGLTPFGKFPDRNLKSLAAEAVTAGLGDGSVEPADLEAVYAGNAVAGLLTGQEMIRGQVALGGLGISGVPIFNVENACASASSAFHLAWQSVASGVHDVVLALGVEKLTHEDKRVSLGAIGAAVDVETRAEETAGPARSLFMDLYADWGKALMERTGITVEDFARVVVKAHRHAALNPKAQYRDPTTVEEVLASRGIVWPLTLLMCSPIGDGAAAAVLMSRDRAQSLGLERQRLVRVLASQLRSGRRDPAEEKATVVAARQAYETAGVGPEDLDCVELHDATAPAELMLYEELELAKASDIPGLLRAGETELGGSLPVNTSGGLLCKGHPIGATGIAQIVEVVEQLRGDAGARQVEGARLGMTHNAGGWLGYDSAAVAVHLFGTDQ